jgi:hypothetical protein
VQVNTFCCTDPFTVNGLDCIKYFSDLKIFFSLSKVRAKKIEVSSKKGVWVTIELKKLVSQWFRHPNENLGLAIHSYDSDGKELAVIEANDNEDTSLVNNKVPEN